MIEIVRICKQAKQSLVLLDLPAFNEYAQDIMSTHVIIALTELGKLFYQESLCNVNIQWLV
jgi:hypothetical protein